MFEAYFWHSLSNWYVLTGGSYIILLEGQPRTNADNVIEERDSQYDAMLSKMVGRIQTKPGGKLEMGEVSWQYLFDIFMQLLVPVTCAEIPPRWLDLLSGSVLTFCCHVLFII